MTVKACEMCEGEVEKGYVRDGIFLCTVCYMSHALKEMRSDAHE